MSQKRPLIVFGAGCIGRGLLGELAARSGRPVVFVEAVESLARELVAAGRYTVRLVGRSTSVTRVGGYRVLMPQQNDEIARIVAECDFVATAVGGQYLARVAPLLVNGLAAAGRRINILLCENWLKAAEDMDRALTQCGADPATYSSVPTSVERMVRAAPGSLDLIGESDESLFLDAARWTGSLPDIAGLDACGDLTAYSARKLFTNNAGHALLAYEGHLAGYELLCDAHADPVIQTRLSALLGLAAEMLAREYRLERTTLDKHARILIEHRFANRELADPVRRVARDPLRKLAPDERLVGLLRRLMKHDLPVAPVCRAIAAALHYVDPADAQTRRLRELVACGGPAAVLGEICRLGPDEQPYRIVLAEWREIRKESKSSGCSERTSDSQSAPIPFTSPPGNRRTDGGSTP